LPILFFGYFVNVDGCQAGFPEMSKIKNASYFCKTSSNSHFLCTCTFIQNQMQSC